MLRPANGTDKSGDEFIAKCVNILVMVVIGGCLLVYSAIACSLLFFGLVDCWKSLTDFALPPLSAANAKIQPHPLPQNAPPTPRPTL